MDHRQPPRPEGAPGAAPAPNAAPGSPAPGNPAPGGPVPGGPVPGSPAPGGPGPHPGPDHGGPGHHPGPDRNPPPPGAAGLGPLQDPARRAFRKLYGDPRGDAVCDTVLPGVMADFRRALSRGPEGRPIREVYRLDDGRGEVIIDGCREGGAVVIHSLHVAGHPVDFGPGGRVILPDPPM